MESGGSELGGEVGGVRFSFEIKIYSKQSLSNRHVHIHTGTHTNNEKTASTVEKNQVAGWLS